MRTHPASCLIAVAVLAIGVGIASSEAWGAGGTSQIAYNGQKVSAQSHWPEGLEALLNDPARSSGWKPWFTEWPNDVVHYQLEVKDTVQANKLVEIFSRIKAESLHLHLSIGKEPKTIGWASKLEEGNNTAIVFTMGNQDRLDQWFARLPGGKFGVMEFEKAPIAVPPTLTIFVQNESIDLPQLIVPAQIHVSAGYLPGSFHISNLKQPKVRAQGGKPIEQDAAAQQATEAIKRFIAARQQPD